MVAVLGMFVAITVVVGDAAAVVGVKERIWW